MAMNQAIKVMKGHRPPVTRDIIKRRQEKAYSVSGDWDKMLPANVKHVIQCYTDSIGVPIDFLFFPMLTTTSSVMQYSTIRLSNTWVEPCIIWTMVVARKGEKKSAALKYIADALRKVEKRVKEEELLNTSAEESQTNSPDDKPDDKPDDTRLYMLNCQITFKKMFDTMMDNNGSFLMLFDEIASFHELLESSNGQVDKKVMLSLNGGDTWCRSSVSSGTGVLDETRLNYTGKSKILK